MKKLMAAFIITFTITAMLMGYKYYAHSTGDEGTSWLFNMWGVRFFGLHSDSNEDFEIIYQKSLQPRASKDQSLIDYTVKNKCNDSSWRCSAIMTAASNLLIDNDQIRVGLRGAIEAYERTHGKCSIMLETTIISYHLRDIALSSSLGARDKARTLVKKIKTDGGILHNLREEACRDLALQKPEYFTVYSLLVSKLMAYSDGKDVSSAAHIDSMKQQP